MKNLSDLRIYKLGIEIGEIVWKIVISWDSFSKWTIGNQFVSSADSISANMMEGYYRNQKGDLRKFFRYALASAKESELWMWKAYNREIIDKEEYAKLRKYYDELLPKLTNFINKID